MNNLLFKFTAAFAACCIALPLYASGAEVPAIKPRPASRRQASASAGGIGEIKVYADGIKLTFDTPPVIQNGTTLLPARVIFEALSMDVEWDNDEEKAVISKNFKYIEIFAGKNFAKVDGVTVTLDVPAVLMGTRLMVPVRFIAENAGATVTWAERSNSIYISTYKVLQDEVAKPAEKIEEDDIADAVETAPRPVIEDEDEEEIYYVEEIYDFEDAPGE